MASLTEPVHVDPPTRPFVRRREPGVCLGLRAAAVRAAVVRRWRAVDATTDVDVSEFELLGAPLVFTPTATGFGLSVVLARRAIRRRCARACATRAAPTGSQLRVPTSPAFDAAEWSITGLEPGRRYAYEICVGGDACDRSLYVGSAITARPPGATFTFAAMADSHIEPRDPIPPGSTVGPEPYSYMESTLRAVAADIAVAEPDFIVNMGDLLDYHLFGFNDPPPDSAWARLAYLNYRRMMGDTIGRAAHFPVIGNWDGESGCNTAEQRERSLSQRLRYVPAPAPGTHPEGGSANQDYYAFTWGDALFIVLNVMTYTESCHLLGINPGLPDDWTLGAAQLAWLERDAGATPPRSGASPSFITPSAATRATRSTPPTAAAAGAPPASASKRSCTTC